MFTIAITIAITVISPLPLNNIHIITELVLRSMAAIASAVAFCVMVTNTVFTNGEWLSYGRIAGFRYASRRERERGGFNF